MWDLDPSKFCSYIVVEALFVKKYILALQLYNFLLKSEIGGHGLD